MCDLAWPCLTYSGLVWPFIVSYGFFYGILWQNVDLNESSFLAVIDPNSFGLVWISSSSNKVGWVIKNMGYNIVKNYQFWYFLRNLKYSNLFQYFQYFRTSAFFIFWLFRAAVCGCCIGSERLCCLVNVRGLEGLSKLELCCWRRPIWGCYYDFDMPL